MLAKIKDARYPREFMYFTNKSKNWYVRLTALSADKQNHPPTTTDIFEHKLR